MYTDSRTLGLLTIALCAFKMQAYTYTITNLTDAPHSVQLKLIFFGAETPWQDDIGTVQPGKSLVKEYGAGDAYAGFCFSQLAIDNNPVYVMKLSTASPTATVTDDLKKLIQDRPKFTKFWGFGPKTHSTLVGERDELFGACYPLSFFIIPTFSAFGVVGRIE